MDGMTATYSPEDNKLRLYALRRLDAETFARVKAHGFRWAPKQELFVAPAWSPSREDLLLELADEIGDEDTSLVERAEAKADRLEDLAERRKVEAAAANKAVDTIAGRFAGGQPILVGHHSEKKARKDAERIESGMRKVVRLWDQASYWQSRAQGALHLAKYKERPDVRARRIKSLEAELRKVERSIKENSFALKAWRLEGLTLEQARTLSNRFYFNVAPYNPQGHNWTAYDVLRPDGERYEACPAWTVAQVVETAERVYGNALKRAERWTAHLNNRLSYERAMLGETGYIEPPKKPSRAVLPLLNYPEPVEVQNPFHHGQTETYTPHPMTQEEYKKIWNDYKGTRLSADGSHRVRVAYVSINGGRRLLTAVFLTDAKRHPKPTGAAPTGKAEADVAARIAKGQEALERDVAEYRQAREHNRAVVKAHVQGGALPLRPTEDTQAPDVAGLRAALKAGVQIVAAPNLFPTPPDIAAQVVEAADLRPGDRVLEPSAGTGALLEAVERSGVKCDLVAVEVNNALCRRLNTLPASGRTIEADFLACNGELGVFQRIIMNPPFDNGADIKHILHALHMLEPGGRLVALCANGPRQQDALRPLATRWEPLPAGSFKQSGTMVNVTLLVIDKAPAGLE